MTNPRIVELPAPSAPKLPPDVYAALTYWQGVRHVQRPTIVTAGGGPVPVNVHTITEPPLSGAERQARAAAADLLETYFTRAALGYLEDLFGEDDA